MIFGMEDLHALVEDIQARNRRVEAEKGWETSFVRRGCIAGITYVTACVFLYGVGNGELYVHALVPTGGYLLSTLSLPWVKAWWIAARSRER